MTRLLVLGCALCAASLSLAEPVRKQGQRPLEEAKLDKISVPILPIDDPETNKTQLFIYHPSPIAINEQTIASPRLEGIDIQTLGHIASEFKKPTVEFRFSGPSVGCGGSGVATVMPASAGEIFFGVETHPVGEEGITWFDTPTPGTGLPVSTISIVNGASLVQDLRAPAVEDKKDSHSQTAGEKWVARIDPSVEKIGLPSASYITLLEVASAFAHVYAAPDGVYVDCAVLDNDELPDLVIELGDGQYFGVLPEEYVKVTTKVNEQGETEEVCRMQVEKAGGQDGQGVGKQEVVLGETFLKGRAAWVDWERKQVGLEQDGGWGKALVKNVVDVVDTGA